MFHFVCLSFSLCSLLQIFLHSFMSLLLPIWLCHGFLINFIVLCLFIFIPPLQSPPSLALGVDLRRTDIQRQVPCLQHWHFCQTLMAPLNTDVWREELSVSPPSSSSSSASPLLRVRCTVAGCSLIMHEPYSCAHIDTEKNETKKQKYLS